MSGTDLHAGSPTREKSNVSEQTEMLRFQHINILKSLQQYGKMADTTAAQPAALQRRMAAMEAEAAHEKRIAHLQQNAARRMRNSEIIRGWTAWQDAYLERQRHLRMLAGAAGRLMKPALRGRWHLR